MSISHTKYLLKSSRTSNTERSTAHQAAQEREEVRERASSTTQHKREEVRERASNTERSAAHHAAQEREEERERASSTTQHEREKVRESKRHSLYPKSCSVSHQKKFQV